VPRPDPDTASPLPDWLDAPMRAALHDLQQPYPVPIRYGFTEDARGRWISIKEFAPDGGITGLWIPPETEGAGLTAWLAGVLQEQFFWESVTAWGEARPACPGHPHPAVAAGDERDAWWECPVDGRRIAAIGAY
jgi:hypothetical protein